MTSQLVLKLNENITLTEFKQLALMSWVEHGCALITCRDDFPHLAYYKTGTK